MSPETPPNYWNSTLHKQIDTLHIAGHTQTTSMIHDNLLTQPAGKFLLPVA